MRRSIPPAGRAAAAALVLAFATAAVAAPPPAVLALENETFFFRAKDGSVLAVLTLQLLADRPRATPVPGAGDPSYVGAVSVEETGRRGEALPGASPRAVPLEIASTTTKEASVAFFGRVYLQSGKRYAFRYVVKDAAGDEIFLKTVLVVVPYLTGGFSASSVVPAERFGPAGEGSDLFQVGSEEVVPKVGGIFRRSDLLRLYLQVYDARVDHETGQRRVDVVYRFYRKDTRSSKRHGKPFSVRGAAGPSMGLALPIGDWPPGAYRVVVELHDRVVGDRTTTECSFSIVAE